MFDVCVSFDFEILRLVLFVFRILFSISIHHYISVIQFLSLDFSPFRCNILDHEFVVQTYFSIRIQENLMLNLSRMKIMNILVLPPLPLSLSLSLSLSLFPLVLLSQLLKAHSMTCCPFSVKSISNPAMTLCQGNKQ